MTTFDSWRRQTDASKPEQTPDDMRKIRLAIQAAVSADLLVNDKNWDPYLRYVQAACEQIAAGIEAREEQLRDPRMVDQNAIMQIKIALADLNGQRLALKWALTLPSAISKTGKIAKDLHPEPLV